MVTTITIDNTSSTERGEKIIKKLKAITDGNYHNFKYLLCPAYGSLDIVVESDYQFDGADPQKEMLEFFNYMLVGALTKGE